VASQKKVPALDSKVQRFKWFILLNINALDDRAFPLSFLLFFFWHLLKFVLVDANRIDKFNQRQHLGFTFTPVVDVQL